MRDKPRTCPSIRFRRLMLDALISFRMPSIYPYRVWVTSPKECRMADAHHAGHAAHASHQSCCGSHATDERVRDPVCGMTVDPHKTPHRHQHAGRTYHFCGKRCLEKFVAEP